MGSLSSEPSSNHHLLRRSLHSFSQHIIDLTKGPHQRAPLRTLSSEQSQQASSIRGQGPSDSVDSVGDAGDRRKSGDWEQFVDC
jgi:hypothetical protein